MNPRKVAAIACCAAAIIGPVLTGPPAQSATLEDYLQPKAPKASVAPIMDVGDIAPNGYKMAGILDGLGAYDNFDGTFTVLANHEIPASLGVPRAHGATGAFVSKWTIDKRTLAVRKGEDLITQTWLASGATWFQSPSALSRLCSATLADRGELFNYRTGKGTKSRIFFNGEETGPEGRAFATVVDGVDAGKAFELAWMGNASWENVAPRSVGDTTILVGSDDSNGGQVYVYVGTKQRQGNAIERAGLVGGKLYGVKLADVSLETDATTAGERDFSLVEIESPETLTGAALETLSNNLGVTKFARPEDVAWSLNDRGTFYLATTASFTGISRLWELDFESDFAGGV